MQKKIFNGLSYSIIFYLVLILLDSFVELLTHSTGTWESLFGFQIIKLTGFLNFNIELNVKSILTLLVFIFIWTVGYVIYKVWIAKQEEA